MLRGHRGGDRRPDTMAEARPGTCIDARQRASAGSLCNFATPVQTEQCAPSPLLLTSAASGFFVTITVTQRISLQNASSCEDAGDE